MKSKKLILFIGVLVAVGIGGGTVLWKSSQQLPSGAISNEQVVKIGAILPLTGPASTIGSDEKLGIELALSKGPQRGPKVKMEFADSQGKAQVAVTIMRKFLDIEDVRIHVVTTTTPVMATLPAYKEAGKDVLAVVQCTVPNVTVGYPFAFRIYPTTTEETEVLAAYSNHQKFKRIGVFFMRNQAGEEAFRFFKEKLGEGGADIPIADSFALETKDFRTTLAKFNAKNLDAIFVFAYPSLYPIILRQMQELGMTMAVLGNLSMPLGGIDKKVPREMLDRVVFPAPRYYFASGDQRVEEFNKSITAQGREPNFDMAFMYDAIQILDKAIQSANSGEPQQVANAIMKLMPYDGITGSISLNKNRDSRVNLKLCRWGAHGIELANRSLQE